MSHKLDKSSKLFVAVLLALTLVFSQYGVAYASDPAQVVCEDNGGTWSGSNVNTGLCTWGAGSAVALDACGNDTHAYKRSYVSGTLTGDQCTQTVFSYGSTCADMAEGGDQQEEITPCYTNNSSATFGPGACSGNCVVSSSLPRDAANNLPGDSLDTLYVMVRDEDGNPTTDSYTVCFNNASGALLTIYRFVSGAWSAFATSSGDPICATASGDGAFYLGAAN